jgi:hypothetical protein
MDVQVDQQRTVILEDESLRQFAGGFTSIPNRVLRNGEISLGARMCYAMLLSYAWQDNFCFPAQLRLADDLGIGERTVRQYLNELREATLITWKQQGLNRPNIYRIMKLPALVSPNGHPGPAESAAPDRKNSSGQDRHSASDYKDSRKNTQIVERSNVGNVSNKETTTQPDSIGDLLRTSAALSPRAQAAYEAYKRVRATRGGDAAPPATSHPLKRAAAAGLTDEQVGFARVLEEDMIETLGRPHQNLGYYRVLSLDAFRQGYDDAIRQSLSATRAADVPRGTVANRSAYFTKILRAEAVHRRLTLPIKDATTHR